MATEPLDHRREAFLALAETAFDQMFGGDGQNGLVTFAEREERACEVTDGLARRLMAEHLAQDPTGQVAEGQNCPICRRPVPRESAKSVEPQVRQLMTRRGPIEYRRAGVRCPRCRKIFFPPG